MFLKHISVQEKSRKAIVTEEVKIEEERRPWTFPVSQSAATSSSTLLRGIRISLLEHASHSVYFDTYSRAAFYENSGNIAAGRYRMRVQKKHKPLQTRKERNYMLKKHVYYGNKTLSLFSSADMSVSASLQRGRKKMDLGRGPIRMAFIDDAVRARLGYPFFQMKDEMLHYAVSDPYSRGYEYYATEVIYPYVVIPREIAIVWEGKAVKWTLGTMPREEERSRFLDKFVHSALKKKYGKDFSLSLDSRTGAIVAEELLDATEKDTDKVDDGKSEVDISGEDHAEIQYPET